MQQECELSGILTDPTQPENKLGEALQGWCRYQDMFLALPQAAILLCLTKPNHFPAPER